ncbi:MAG: hypothetical protein L0271_04070, partial [Gemmatimonadetes bacterium]|nr:hypothetical protein [Gemmatimonadota bacterium]
MDGVLDEEVWSRIAPESGFLQTEPIEGQPVSERTEARIFYDDRNLYFGFWCYDREPGKIIARYDTHDARTFSDSMDIFLDPFGDRRTGYYFSVNARGIQYDALLTEASGLDGTWDGIWGRQVPGSLDGLRALHATGVALAIVSNSDGTLEERLAREGICQVGPGAGVPMSIVIDSAAVGIARISPANTYTGLTKPGLGEPHEPGSYRPSGKVNFFRVVPADDIQG